MNLNIKLTLLPICALALFAQGPGGGRMGGRGFGGPAGFAGRGPDMLGAGPGRAVVTGAPFSGTETLTEQQSLTNGNSISNKWQSNVYRDGQGRTRTEETITPAASTGKSPYTIITIFDPVAGYRYVLDSSTMTARQFPAPKLPSTSGATPPARPARPTPPNVTITDLGTATVNGEAAKGTQVTETIPAGAIGNAQPIQVVRVTWVSTELNVPVQIKTSDPRNGSRDFELTNIAHAEPNPSLFVVPAGYTTQQGGGRGPGGGPRANDRRGPSRQ